MTQEQWATTLAPIVAAVAAMLVLLIGTVATGLNAALKAWLAARVGAAQSQVISDAATRVQNAMQNEAGQLVLEIGAGKLDVTNLAAVRARAAQSEAAVIAKLPDAMDLLKPMEGAIAGAIVGKLGTLTMSAPAAAPVAGSAP